VTRLNGKNRRNKLGNKEREKERMKGRGRKREKKRKKIIEKQVGRHIRPIDLLMYLDKIGQTRTQNRKVNKNI
jgi:hypothetical protein